MSSSLRILLARRVLSRMNKQLLQHLLLMYGNINDPTTILDYVSRLPIQILQGKREDTIPELWLSHSGVLPHHQVVVGSKWLERNLPPVAISEIVVMRLTGEISVRGPHSYDD